MGMCAPKVATLENLCLVWMLSLPSTHRWNLFLLVPNLCTHRNAVRAIFHANRRQQWAYVLVRVQCPSLPLLLVENVTFHRPSSDAVSKVGISYLRKMVVFPGLWHFIQRTGEIHKQQSHEGSQSEAKVQDTKQICCREQQGLSDTGSRFLLTAYCIFLWVHQQELDPR